MISAKKLDEKNYEIRNSTFQTVGYIKTLDGGDVVFAVKGSDHFFSADLLDAIANKLNSVSGDLHK